VDASSKACVCGRFLFGNASSNPSWSKDVCVFFNFVPFQVEISALGQFLVQRSRSECDVSECDREASLILWSWPSRVCCVMEKYFLFDDVCSDISIEAISQKHFNPYPANVENMVSP